MVLKKVHDPTRLGILTSGPYKVQHVHVNGTITVQLRLGATERINIQRIIPYRYEDDNKQSTQRRFERTRATMLT